jgi:hypothetical protein
MKRDIDSAIGHLLATLPHEMAKEREAIEAGLDGGDLDAAMRRLFKKGKIRLEEYTGINGNQHVRIVEVP